MADNPTCAPPFCAAIIKRNVLAVCMPFLLLHVNVVTADTWAFKNSEREFKLAKGLRAIVTTNAKKSARSPDFHFKLYDGKKLVAHYPGLAVEHIVSSPDGNLFVGLSNRGIPGTAAVVFTRNGSLRVLAIHGLAEFDYCDKSVTVARRWYDEENPNVRFDGPSETGGITIRNCHGQQISLLETIAKAYNNALRQAPENEPR